MGLRSSGEPDANGLYIYSATTEDEAAAPADVSDFLGREGL